MSIKLVDTLESMGNFPVANADGIQFTDGESLQKKLDDGTLGGGAEAYVEMSQTEYDALTDEEKMNGAEYRTYDTGHIYKRGVIYGKDLGVSDEVSDSTVWSSKKTSGEIDKITYSTDANECIPALMKTARYNLINTSANVPNSNYSWVLTAEHIKLSTGQYYRIIQDINGTKSDGGTIKYTRTATSTDDATWTWSDWVVDALISDTNLTSTTSTLSASKVKNAVTYNFDTQAGSVKYVKFKLHTTTISVVDNYGGKIEILGANNSPSNPNYKTAKVVRLSYGDWNSHDAIQVPSAVHTKIGELYYYSTDEYYYLKLYNYAYFTMTGLATAPEMITSLPVDVSEMTLIPESDWGRISDTTSSITSTYSSAKIDEKIAEHSLPLVFDSGIRGNATIEIYKLSNVTYEASGGENSYNLNLILSTRAGEEIELFGGKNDSGWLLFAKRNNNYSTKIIGIYQDGYDVYVKLATYFNYFRVYHKSGVLRDDFAVTQVSSVPDTATEIVIKGETVADKEPTDITFNGDSTYFKLAGGNQKYEIKNGVCYFQMYIQTQGSTTTDMKPIANLPKPKYEKNFNVAPYVWSNDKYTPLRASITTDGVLQACIGGTWYSYFIEGSYPVKA